MIPKSTMRGPVVFLRGGLGNQLFQFAYFLKLKSDGRNPTLTSVLLGDRGAFNTSRVLEISALVQDDEWNLDSRKMKVLGRFFYLLDATKSFIPARKNMSLDRKYVAGYFQDASIVSEVWPELCERMKTATGFCNLVSDGLQERVVIHYRLGDYRTNKRASRLHGVLSPEYYRKALETQENYVQEVFLESDEPQLARIELEATSINISPLSATSTEALESLLNLATARLVVISNSTFAWWGAWCAWKKGADVVAPTPWFREKDCPELFPVEWARVERCTGG